MIVAVSLAAAVLFGGGAYLLLQHDLIRVVAGVLLVSQSAVVTMIGASQSRGRAPIYPPHGPLPGERISDPLPQALALTALVIGLATVALLLALVRRIVVVFHTTRREELAYSEQELEVELEPERRLDRDEAGR